MMDNVNQTHPADWVLHAYLDGELTPAERSELELHLAECPACAAQVANLQALFAAVDGLPEMALELDLAPAVLARIERPAVGMMPAVRWAALAQLMLAGAAAPVALAFAWPSLAALIGRATSVYGRLTAGLGAWALALGREWAAWGESAAGLPAQLAGWGGPTLALPTAGLGLLLAAALLVWLVGNRLLLRDLGFNELMGG